MPYTLTWEPQGVIKTFTGFVSGEEFVRSVEEVLLDDRFGALEYIVNDLLAIEGHGMDAEKTHWVAAMRVGSHSFNPRLRIVVVTRDPAVRRIAQLTTPQDASARYETRAFDTLAAARAWLGAPAA